MAQYILFDLPLFHEQLKPFTLSRPVADIRMGILTMREKWEHYLLQKVEILSQSYFSLPPISACSDETVFINAALIPTAELLQAVSTLSSNQAIFCNDTIVAAKGKILHYQAQQYKHTQQLNCEFVSRPWDIFQKNHQAIKDDFVLVTKGKTSQTLHSSNTVLGANQVFVAEGAQVFASVFNTTEGPIYIGKNAEVMEGCLVRGPFSLGENSTLKMAAKIYNGTTIGPHCKVGGEVSNSVIFGYSNKAHDGFLGNSVLGEWCNLGADSNTSNLKNNYSKVQVWDYVSKAYINTGLQFCGLLMGDHAKSSINTMFNTGTVVGFSANVFGGGFPPKFIPSFSWGGFDKEVFKLDAAMDVASKVMSRRNLSFSPAQSHLFQHLFENR